MFYIRTCGGEVIFQAILDQKVQSLDCHVQSVNQYAVDWTFAWEMYRIKDDNDVTLNFNKPCCFAVIIHSTS
jgi:hypothetical protein